MNKILLKAEPLTKKAFAPFGDVIEIQGATHFPINEKTVERYHDLANVQVDSEAGGRAIISFMEITTPRTLPHSFNLVERHPKGSQAFIPMFDAPVALVVGPKGDDITGSDLKAFITNGKQGFNFHAGVWHMPLMSDVKGRLVLIVDRSGPGKNCDEVTLENELIELHG